MTSTKVQHELAQEGSISCESHNILLQIQGQRCTHCQRPFYCPTRKIQDRVVSNYPNEAARPILIDLTKTDEPSLYMCSYCTTVSVSFLASKHYFDKGYRPVNQDGASYLSRCNETSDKTTLLVIVLPDFEGEQ